MSQPKLSANDLGTLRDARRAQAAYGGYIPHGASEHLAVKRLCAAGLLEYLGEGVCEDCDNPKHRYDGCEYSIYVLTAKGGLVDE